jgi:hypothetical protein
VLTARVFDGPDLLCRILPLSGKLIRCQRDHDDYAIFYKKIAMSDNDETDSSTLVFVARRV